MTTVRTHASRLILVVSGLLIIAGGRMHPSAEAGGSLREELAEMTADPSWVPGHTLVMLGTLGIVMALWWARSLGVWSRTGRAVTVAPVAMSLYAVETVFHLAAVVDADKLAHGHAAPVAFTHIGLSVVLYPVAGAALAWLGTSLMRTESGVRRSVMAISRVSRSDDSTVAVPRCAPLASALQPWVPLCLFDRYPPCCARVILLPHRRPSAPGHPNRVMNAQVGISDSEGALSAPIWSTPHRRRTHAGQEPHRWRRIVSTEPAGWTRLVVKSKFGMDRDFEALDHDGRRVWFVDGKFGARPAAEVQDAAGTVTHRLRGRLFGIPKQIVVSDAEGKEVASIRAKISPLKSKMIITLTDGGEWVLEGNLIEKDYTITSGGAVVAAISQKFLTMRDTYTIDIGEGVDHGLAMATLWAVDAFREQR